MRLALLLWGMRWFAKPLLARSTAVRRINTQFARLAVLFRAPPFVKHLAGTGDLPLDEISVGRVCQDRIILYFHGGGYVAGSPATHSGMLGRISKLSGLRVVAPAYRLAPDHPAPAAFNDACAAHAALLRQGYLPDQIILGGDSAGGGLALALLARLCARDLQPLAVFVFSPWTDLAMTGASVRDNATADPLLPANGVKALLAQVLGGLAPTDPRISPLYGCFNNPPPVLIQVGRTEILRDDSRRIAVVLQGAGGQVRLSEYARMPHVWQIFDGYLPQARAALCEVAGFIAQAIRDDSGKT